MQKLLFLLLFVTVSATAQTTEDIIKVHLNNTKTTQHVRIPGTHIFMIPPTGFTVTKLPTGMGKGDEAMLTISDGVGGNYYTNMAPYSFSAEMRKRGITKFDTGNITVNGLPGTYIIAQTDQGIKTFMLGFGDSTFCALVTGQCLNSDDQSAKELVAAMNSMYYDKSQRVDPFETARFSLDSSYFKFRMTMMSGMFAYAPDSMGADHQSHRSSLMVQQMAADKSLSLEMTIDLALGQERAKGIGDMETTYASDKTINGNKAFEKVVEIKTEAGERSIQYMLAITNGDVTVMFMGIIMDHIDEDLREAKRLAYSLTLK
jgi:hypothetical protein